MPTPISAGRWMSPKRQKTRAAAARPIGRSVADFCSQAGPQPNTLVARCVQASLMRVDARRELLVPQLSASEDVSLVKLELLGLMRGY
ncbi:hypothetical protein NDU88_002452 [Pleurodeles waltl]|uniref:Uncharacterized protein n=1 Tax=Pleurodeles waltl TaxID=8319 RepID=A0AAV7UVP2_PLEWA|nr:hypothetical protein NDU88_002452 [Pleurodeles waltl]